VADLLAAALGHGGADDDVPVHELLSHREHQVFERLRKVAAWARSPKTFRCRRTRSAPTARASSTRPARATTSTGAVCRAAPQADPMSPPPHAL